jgi:N utilization substance protein A
MKSDFLVAIAQLAAEKNLPREVVFEAVEAALASAYRKDAHATANVQVKVDPNSGSVQIYAEKTVVDEVEDPKAEISLEDAMELRRDAAIGEVVNIEIEANNSSRIAAQTMKQVVLQRLREAEREAVFEKYSGKEGDIVSGIVQRVEPKQVIMELDLGKVDAILPQAEQVRSEHYRPGQRLKVYLVEVYRSNKGPQVIVSRTHKHLLRRLFELEVPEIFKGIVEIKSIAREAGYRSKVAVAARQEGIDAVGACVGLRGIRIQNIVNEMNGERIDVIQWDPDPARFVAHALSPAQVVSVSIAEAENTASVVVPDRMLSLAIGKEGQNARLAAKLTGWRIDIKSQTMAQEEASLLPAISAEPEPVEEVPEPVSVAVSPVVEEQEEPLFEPEVEEEPVEVAAEVVEAPIAEPETAKPQIRFAEEVLTPAAAEAAKARKARERTRTEREEEAARARRPRRGGRRFEEDDELDEYEEFLRHR